MNLVKKYKGSLILLSATSLAFALTACGGGGGSSDGGSTGTTGGATLPTQAPVTSPTPTLAPTATPTVAPTASPSSILSTVLDSAPNGVVNADASAKAMTKLNDARALCGMDTLTDSRELKAAADAASNYFSFWFFDGDRGYAHQQDPTRSLFTGVMPWDRAQYQGYPTTWVNENLTTSIISADYVYASANETAVYQVERLLNTVYHLIGLMGDDTEVGASFISVDGKQYYPENLKWHDKAYRLTLLGGRRTNENQAIKGGTSVVTYPCQGAVVVNQFKPAEESPNPMQGISDAPLGTPIGFRAPRGTTLTLTSYAIYDAKGTVVPAMLFDKLNQGGGVIPAHNAVLVPKAPLNVGEVYRVTATGSFAGGAFGNTPMTIDFTFTTKEGKFPAFAWR